MTSNTKTATRSTRSNPAQLRLLAPDGSWMLDERTKRIGREGLAKARAVLAAHPAPFETHTDVAA